MRLSAKNIKKFLYLLEKSYYVCYNVIVKTCFLLFLLKSSGYKKQGGRLVPPDSIIRKEFIL
jgi:hypothetical protein